MMNQRYYPRISTFSYVIMLAIIWNFLLLLQVHGKPKAYKQTYAARKSNHEVCNDVGEIESKDPCRPMCACVDGQVMCAEIHCSSKVPDSCAKVTPTTRCCPTYVCYDEDGLSYMRYPLPRVIVPSELQSFQAADHRDKKSLDKSEKLP